MVEQRVGQCLEQSGGGDGAERTSILSPEKVRRGSVSFFGERDRQLRRVTVSYVDPIACLFLVFQHERLDQGLAPARIDCQVIGLGSGAAEGDENQAE